MKPGDAMAAATDAEKSRPEMGSEFDMSADEAFDAAKSGDKMAYRMALKAAILAVIDEEAEY